MTISQRRAGQARHLPAERSGISRFEVVGRDADRDLLRFLARRLAEGDAAAVALRDSVRRAIRMERRPGDA